MTRLSVLAVALAAGLMATLTGPAGAAGLDWLVLLIDRSRSISQEELTLQRRAYLRLLNDPDVISALGAAQVAIVEFDSKAEIMVDWTDPKSAAELYALQESKGLRRQTAIGNALTTALDLLDGKDGRLVIDVSGDGKENVDPNRLAYMRGQAGARRVEINGLAILNEQMKDLDRYYSQKVVNNFVITTSGLADFETALQRKLFYEIAGEIPPEAVTAAAATEGHAVVAGTSAPGRPPSR